MDPETTNQRSKRTDIYALGMVIQVQFHYFPFCVFRPFSGCSISLIDFFCECPPKVLSAVKPTDDEQEIVTGTIPYFPECRIDYQIFTKLSRKELPKQTMDFTRNERGERMWALLVQCWDHNPAARPMAYYVLDEVCLITDKIQHIYRIYINNCFFSYSI